MGIGGGLYDHDPEPDRYREPVPWSRIKAAQREWLFWAVMVFGVWVAAQGQFLTVFLLLFTAVSVAASVFLVREARRQWREAREKGTWK